MKETPEQAQDTKPGQEVAGGAEAPEAGKAGAAAENKESGRKDPAAELAELREQAAKHFDLYIRAAAELENTRRRCEEEMAKTRKFAVADFAGQMLAVADSLEAAIKAAGDGPSPLKEGVETTYKQMVGALERVGVRRFFPQGEKFDPHTQQAVMMMPAPEGVAPGCVAQVFQPGWMIADRVLRPAMVAVAQGS